MTHTAALRRPLAHAHRLCAWAGLAGLLTLQGCSTPIDVRKDAEFQSYATQSDRPVVRPTRSISRAC